MDGNHDLAGKTMVVTGATSGIGRAAVRALARRGAYVIGVGRALERCEAAQEAICGEDPDARVAFALADLSSQRQVRQLAADIGDLVSAAGGGKVDVLVNNAGTVATWRTLTEDGYELQFAVNHLAPFLLTHELMPLLQAAPSARVVTVSSSAHFRRARIHWDDVMYRKHYHVLKAYKQSKLANVIFTVELNRRYGADGTFRAYAADPGLVNTGIGLKATHGLERWVWNMRRKGGVTPEEGAATLVLLASGPAVADAESIYWKHGRPLPPSPVALDEESGARLWALSERLCGLS